MDGLYFSLKEGGLKKDEECYSRYGSIFFNKIWRISVCFVFPIFASAHGGKEVSIYHEEKKDGDCSFHTP
jgi:hypothetical protein